MKVPLLLICEIFEDDDEEQDACEYYFVDGHLGLRDEGGEESNVRWSRYEAEEELRRLLVLGMSVIFWSSSYVLVRRDEGYVEDEEGPFRNPALENLPTVVLGALLIPSFSPIVECESSL